MEFCDFPVNFFHFCELPMLLQFAFLPNFFLFLFSGVEFNVARIWNEKRGMQINSET